MRNVFVIRGVARTALAVLTVASSALAQSRPPVDPRLYAGLTWRNLGPFRGGRIAAVSGAIGQPGTFYIGLPAGGVWKTTSAGADLVPDLRRDQGRRRRSARSKSRRPIRTSIYVGTGDIDHRRRRSTKATASTSRPTPGAPGGTSGSTRRSRSRR